ncbi:hypothetical protein [Bradyrhizobium sp. USDA 4369]
MDSEKTKDKYFRDAIWTRGMALSRDAKSVFRRMRFSSPKQPGSRAAAYWTARRATHLRGKSRSQVFCGLVGARGSLRSQSWRETC